MNNECKGCNLEGDCVDGVKPHFSETKQCPCINCIVKVICHDACEEWKNYLELFDRRKDGKQM